MSAPFPSNYDSWRKRKDYMAKLYEKFWDGNISELELRKLEDEYDGIQPRTSLCIHVEGSTAIGGFIICKICGSNLRKV